MRTVVGEPDIDTGSRARNGETDLASTDFCAPHTTADILGCTLRSPHREHYQALMTFRGSRS